MSEDIETISADTLRDIIARGEATRYISDVGVMVKISRLARAMRKAELKYKKVAHGPGDYDAYMRYAAAYDALVTALDALAADLDAAENLTDFGNGV